MLGRTRKLCISYIPAWWPCALDFISVAHIMKPKDFLFGRLVFSSHSLLSTLPSWLFSKSVRSLTVPEDTESIYLQKIKGVKFAGDVNWWFSCGQRHLSQHRFWSCASNSKDHPCWSCAILTLWNRLILNIYNLSSAQCLEHFCWYNSPL